MIDINGMPTCLGLFYAYRSENHVHCMFIFTFLVFLYVKRIFFWLVAWLGFYDISTLACYQMLKAVYLSLILSRVIPKAQKWYLTPLCLTHSIKQIKD